MISRAILDRRSAAMEGVLLKKNTTGLLKGKYQERYYRYADRLWFPGLAQGGCDDVDRPSA